MRTALVFVLAAAVYALSSPAHAVSKQLSDGNALLDSCSAAIALTKQRDITIERTFTAFHCLGYLDGLLDAHAIYRAITDARMICLPDQGIRTGQAVRIVVHHLRENPEKLHQSARLLAHVALATEFPCE